MLEFERPYLPFYALNFFIFAGVNCKVGSSFKQGYIW